jgi:PKD repeat protein
MALLCLATLGATPNSALDGRKPGSVLIYPIQRAGGSNFTVLSVTNTALETQSAQTLGGGTSTHWQFLNVVPGPTKLMPYTCGIVDRGDYLTPADTTAFLASCWNPGIHEGFAAVSAQDPNYFKADWSHNFLAGSEAVINMAGGMYVLNAIPFSSPQTRGSHTDNDDPFAGVGDGVGDNDGQIDFDGIEYEGVPDDLYGEFIAVPGSSLTLLNLSGGAYFKASVAFDIWNDNEIPLSLQLQFRCWFDEELANLSPVFTSQYLMNNTLDDPTDLDLTCDGVNDIETGWFRIRGLNYSSAVDTCLNPALLGAISAGPGYPGIDGGRLLWESKEKQFNGDFYKFSTDDPECPEDIAMPPDCVATVNGMSSVVVQPNEVFTCDGTGSSDPDGTIASYSWDFTDGTVVMGNDITQAAVMHMYGTPGMYFPKLTLVDDEGLMSMCTVKVTVNDPPICDAGPGQNVAPNSVVQFDGSNSIDNDGVIVQYDWNYDDGFQDIDAGPTPSHAFPNPGIYNVKLTVTDNNGGMSMCFTIVIVNEPPVCDIDIVGQNAPFVAMANMDVQFDGSGSSDPDGNDANLVYDWDFGDGSQALDAGPMPTHQYASPGNYTVTLTLTDEDGGMSECTLMLRINEPPVCNAGAPQNANLGDKVMFDGSASFDPDGTIVQYDWLLGDGQGARIDAGPTPMTMYNSFGVKNITLKVFDNDGKFAICNTTVTVNALPNCVINTDPSPPVAFAGVSIEFDGSSSFDPDGGAIVSYQWNFGDGSPLEFGAIKNHAFASPDDYTVTLTVTDDEGTQSMCTVMVTIPNQLPLCDAGTANPSMPSIGDRVMFDGSASSDLDGTIVTYEWDFDDGSPAAFGAQVIHAFMTGGTFNVKLKVTDNDGGMSMCTTQVVINRPPNCDVGGPYMASLFQEITFDGSGSMDPDGDPITYDWNYGDGSPVDMDAGPMPKHTYTTAGMFTVTLTVTDNFGAFSQCETSVEILDVCGALAFSGADADEHCQSILCGGYVPALLQWTLDNSSNQGNGILAVGLQQSNLPFFFSLADESFKSWVSLLSNPAIPITRITDPVAFMSVDFDDYQLVYVPSYEEHATGGISQEMLDALFARKADLEEYTLRRGGSLLALTQAEDDDFMPQIQNAYTWSPIPFISDPQRYFFVFPTAFGLNGDPMNGVPAPLPGASAADISHEAWHNTFLPDPVFGFSGLEIFVEGDETGVFGEAAIIGGIPTPPIPATSAPGRGLPNASDLPGTHRGSNQHKLVLGSR